MNWYFDPWKKYAQFGGRARRHGVLDLHADQPRDLGSAVCFRDHVLRQGACRLVPVLLVCWTFGLAAFIPMMACAVRRLHDTGKSGWWLLLIFVPVITLLVFSDHPFANRQLQNVLQYPIVLAPIVGGAILTVFLCLAAIRARTITAPIQGTRRKPQLWRSEALDAKRLLCRHVQHRFHIGSVGAAGRQLSRAGPGLSNKRQGIRRGQQDYCRKLTHLPAPPQVIAKRTDNWQKIGSDYFNFALEALARTAAQRLRCASAIFLRASALSTRFFLGLALAGAFLALSSGFCGGCPDAGQQLACLRKPCYLGVYLGKNIFNRHKPRIIQEVQICSISARFCLHLEAVLVSECPRSAVYPSLPARSELS